ncbi:hypothetical protein AAG906_039618 [Vitis piasezkii]
MLSTPFALILFITSPKGFLVPKFSTYDGSNDPFDHIMHYRQLMTLDIGNDALLCKVFPASLQGQALSCRTSTLQNIKMQDNESLREFVKRFGQAVLQVEAYSMDAVLQIFKRSICPGTPFFESLAKKPPTTMDDLFRPATQQILVAGQASRGGAERSAKLPDRPSRPEMPPLTPLSISYEKLLPMIQDLSDFRWPRPLRTDPAQRDHSKKSHKGGHLKQYLYSDARGRDASRNHNSRTPRAPTAPKAIINYINGGPFDEEYDSKRKRQRLLRAALVHIVLPVQAGPVTLNVQFSVVQDLSPFNVILGHMAALHESHPLHQLLSPADKDPPVADPLQAIQISEEGTHLTYISSLLTPEETRNIQDALRQSHDVFAWAHSNMKGIHPSIVSHKLNVLPTARPVRQRVRRFHPDRQKIIQDEIDKLLEVGFIKEVEYSDWLANVVVVLKKEGKWRVCVDYTNLNNACPKDSFPLPQIDQIVDSTVGQGMFSFLDAFSGYHQIPMSRLTKKRQPS